MLNEIFHTVFQAQQPRTPFYQGNTVHRERALQRRHLKQFVQNDIRVGIAFHINHDAHALSSRLIIGVADTVNLSLFHQFGDIFNQRLLVYTIRNLGDDNLIMVFTTLNLGFCAHHNAATSRLIGLTYPLNTIYIGPRWEVGCFDMLHQSVQRNVRVIDISTAAINHFSKVVGRHIRGHSHGNTIATIH